MMHSHNKKNITLMAFSVGVLILVVMDDALAQQNLGYALFKRIVRLVCASQDMFLTNITYLLSECKITKN